MPWPASVKATKAYSNGEYWYSFLDGISVHPSPVDPNAL